MRHGNIDLPDSVKEVKEIRTEARYYELTNLLELCDEFIDEKLAPGTRDHRNLKFIKNDDEYLQIITEPVKVSIWDVRKGNKKFQNFRLFRNCFPSENFRI